MKTRRSTDRLNTPLYRRTSRIVVEDNGFFYKTRERELRGVFDTETLALEDLTVYIKVMAIEAALEKTDLFKVWA